MRPRIAIVTPADAAGNTGNWHTAARWARYLRPLAAVTIDNDWHSGDAADLLIALHARRSAAAMAAFARAHPSRPRLLVLTGTDLYRDLPAGDSAAAHSLDLATHLVVLNHCAPLRLPATLRRRTTTLLQSAPALRPGRKPHRSFDVAIIGHLRQEKNPELVWAVARQLPPDTRIRLWHVGRALDRGLAAQARAVMREQPAYRWIGELPRGQARQLVRRSHLLLHPSFMEGGALAVIESIMAHTPVLASRIDGNLGLLGPEYPGYFDLAGGNAIDSVAAARVATLLLAYAHEPRLLRALARHCRALRPDFDPAREQRALQRLVERLLGPSQRRRD